MLSRYVIVKSKIAKSKGLLKSYFPGQDVRIETQKKDYVKALLLASNIIESQLRFFYNKDYEDKKGNITAKAVDKNNKIHLSKIINWAKDKKIISTTERKELHKIREIRNDISHTYWLNFNQNLNFTECKTRISKILPIINSLHNRIIENISSTP